MAMSNAQQGTRGLSAGDWIRIQRLRGARNFEADKPGDITGTVVMPQTIYNKAMLIPRDVGTSRIRRPASFYTDFRASQTADFVTQKQTVTSGPAKTLTNTKLCNCTSTTLTPRLTGCKVCSKTPVHNRIQ